MTGISTLGQALSQIRNLTGQQQSLADLTQQLNSGKRTQSFAGLGSDALTSTRSRASFTSLDVYNTNITNADRQIQVLLASVNQIKDQTNNLSGSLLGLSQQSAHQEGEEVFFDDPVTTTIETTRVGYTSAEPDDDLRTLVDLAESLFDVVRDLINTKIGDEHIFNGTNKGEAPIFDTTALDSAVTARIQDWKNGTISNADFLADITNGDTTNNPDAIDDTIIGYTADLVSGNVGSITVRASQTTEIDYTVRANEDPFRDILVGLAILKNPDLTPVSDVYLPPNEGPPNAPDIEGAPGATIEDQRENFFAIFDGVSNLINEAVDGTESIEFRLESARARIDTIRQDNQDTQNFLLGTISDIENVDITEVAVKIQTLSTQLQASYSVTAQTLSLSLVNFI